MKNIDSVGHVRGESTYVDDVVELEGTLHAGVVYSTIPHGRIVSVNVDQAKLMDGVVEVVLAKDIPGENQIGGIIPDEVLLASSHVSFIGEPIALVLCSDRRVVHDAVNAVKVEYERLDAIFEPREAAERGEIIGKTRVFGHGDVDNTWKDCDLIVEGSAKIGGQEHLYIEGQAAYAFPLENQSFKVISSTQGPTLAQKMGAKVLDIPMHKIEVEVARIGGGFGGKEDQATAWAVLALLGSYHTNKPVKLVLERLADLQLTGKRHPYEADYKLGLDKDRKIQAYEVTFYQNAGAAADLSPAVLERTLFHSNNSYYIPNMKATGISCRTNFHPFTAFRGFGGPQGMYVIEAALSHAAKELKVPVWELQRHNLLVAGDMFHYGQPYGEVDFPVMWEELETKFEVKQQLQELEQFNSQSSQFKKGVAFIPICFGISFTKTLLNQAGALVHIYMDGSISVSTGAVEMGQGVNTRIKQVPLRVFDLPENYVKIETTNTTRVINTSASAASSTHDLNGIAAQIACNELLQRLQSVAASVLQCQADQITFSKGAVYKDGELTELTWNDVVGQAYVNRVDLTAHGFYAPDAIHFDTETEKGHPFVYHTVGVGMVEVTLDCLRGTYTFDAVKVVHDFGETMNEIIDLGQMEGGIVQGLGWMSIEELAYDDQGRMLSNALSTYKVPDMDFTPKQIETVFLENSSNPRGLFKSKAIGEPPLLYGIAGFFAIKHAMEAFNSEAEVPFDAPLTPEKVLLILYPSIKQVSKISVP